MPMSGPHKRWKYDLHPSVQMANSVISEMKEKTGRSLDEWVRHVKKNGPSAEKERSAWLKKEHGLGTNYASWIAGKSVGKSDAFEDAGEYLRHAEDFVDKMYAGPKEHLRPIYDEVLSYARHSATILESRLARQSSYLSQARHRADQADNAHAHRSWLALRDTKTPKRLIDTGDSPRKTESPQDRNH